jgi:hypothetical protein
LAHHPSKLNPKWRNWTPDEDKVLGTATDAEIGWRPKRNEGCVRQRRKQLGISPAPRIWAGAWSREEDALLGTAQDEEVAKLLNRIVRAVQARRKDPHIPKENSRFDSLHPLH